MQYLNYIFMTLLILHLLGEFYFLNTELAERVKKGLRWHLIHLIIYASTFFLVRLVMPGLPLVYYGVLVIVHVIIELVCLLILKNEKSIENLAKKLATLVQADNPANWDSCDMSDLINLIVFCFHLLFHVLLFIVLSFLIRKIEVGPLYNNVLLHLLNELGIKGSEAVCWLTKILILCKPGGILIAMLLSRYKLDPEKKAGRNEEAAGNKKAAGKRVGKYIGYLERICILIFMSIGQYGSVGLVLTAKSIARYNEIANDRNFAEYYLLGTLLSTILAVAISLIFSP